MADDQIEFGAPRTGQGAEVAEAVGVYGDGQAASGRLPGAREPGRRPAANGSYCPPARSTCSRMPLSMLG
jgi:hypothetical protein